MSKHAYDPSLASAMGFLTSTGVLVSHRIIMPGDEDALLPEERMTFRPSAPIIYRQSGAARIVARHLLDGMGFSGVALPRSISGVPVWPPGVTGSLAHDEALPLPRLRAPVSSPLSGSTSSLPSLFPRNSLSWSSPRQNAGVIQPA
jgi:4'-phosphopantetheinyl transferase EntD